jgi:hypothetical protein
LFVERAPPPSRAMSVSVQFVGKTEPSSVGEGRQSPASERPLSTEISPAAETVSWLTTLAGPASS